MNEYKEVPNCQHCDARLTVLNLGWEKELRCEQCDITLGHFIPISPFNEL